MNHRLFHVLIPAAGTGTRAGLAMPKQYERLDGVTVLERSARAFADLEGLARAVILAAPDDPFIDTRANALAELNFAIAKLGGSSRAKTVSNGLAWLRSQGARDEDWVLVHDAARCCITPELINTLVDASMQDGVGGLLAIPLADTLKQANGSRVEQTLSRDAKWLAQTPQMFRLRPLAEALQNAETRMLAVTDEASAMELAGYRPLIVKGSVRNLKITYPEDFVLARAWLAVGASND